MCTSLSLSLSLSLSRSLALALSRSRTRALALSLVRDRFFSPSRPVLKERACLLTPAEKGASNTRCSLAAARRAVTPRVRPQIAAYRGLLTFRLGHVHHTGDELHRDTTWGVHLEGPAGLAISALTREGWNSLPIAEDGGWTVTKGSGVGHAPSQLQLLTLLSEVRALKIRGNFFSQSEQTYIDDVALHAGEEDVGKLRERVQKSQQPKVRHSGAKPSGFGAPLQTGHLVGVGLVLMPSLDNGISGYSVKRLQSGSPAHFCQNIEPGDLLVKVDDQLIDGQEKSLKDVARLIMGEEGSQLTLTLFSYARNETYMQVLQRRLMHVEAPHATGMNAVAAQEVMRLKAEAEESSARLVATQRELAEMSERARAALGEARGLESHQNRQVQEHHRKLLDRRKRQVEQKAASLVLAALALPHGSPERLELMKQAKELRLQNGDLEEAPKHLREQRKEKLDARKTAHWVDDDKKGKKEEKETTDEVEADKSGEEKRREILNPQKLQQVQADCRNPIARAEHSPQTASEDGKRDTSSSAAAPSGAPSCDSAPLEFHVLDLDAFERLLFDLPSGCVRAHVRMKI